MATFEIAIDDNKIQDLLQSDQGLSALLGPILNPALDAEMADHLQAASHEQTERRQGFRTRLQHERRFPALQKMTRGGQSDRPGSNDGNR